MRYGNPDALTRCIVTIGMQFCTRFIEDNIIKWEEREASCNHDSGVTVHVEDGNDDDADHEQAGTLESGIVNQYMYKHALTMCLYMNLDIDPSQLPTRRRSSGSLPYGVRSPDVRRESGKGTKSTGPYEISSPEVQSADQGVQSEQEGPTAANSMQNTARRKSDVFSMVSSNNAPQAWPRRRRKKVQQDSHLTSCQCLIQ